MLTTNLAILVLAGFVGFAVISKVPNTLHTPLMSGTNAIHGIVLLGGLLVIGFSGNDLFNKVILVIAIAFGTINVVGGFLVTDRMLGMFKRKPEPPADEEAKPEPDPEPSAEPPTAAAPGVQPEAPAGGEVGEPEVVTDESVTPEVLTGDSVPLPPRPAHPPGDG